MAAKDASLSLKATSEQTSCCRADRLSATDPAPPPKGKGGTHTGINWGGSAPSVSRESVALDAPSDPWLAPRELEVPQGGDNGPSVGPEEPAGGLAQLVW